jgi:hypothetical protein
MNIYRISDLGSAPAAISPSEYTNAEVLQEQEAMERMLMTEHSIRVSIFATSIKTLGFTFIFSKLTAIARKLIYRRRPHDRYSTKCRYVLLRVCSRSPRQTTSEGISCLRFNCHRKVMNVGHAAARVTFASSLVDSRVNARADHTVE